MVGLEGRQGFVARVSIGVGVSRGEGGRGGEAAATAAAKGEEESREMEAGEGGVEGVEEGGGVKLEPGHWAGIWMGRRGFKRTCDGEEEKISSVAGDTELSTERPRKRVKIYDPNQIKSTIKKDFFANITDLVLRFGFLMGSAGQPEMPPRQKGRKTKL